MAALAQFYPQSWIGLVTILTVTAVFCRVIYNAFLHPLSKVPGPFFAGVSGIPSWYHAARGQRHIWLWQLFQIYGPRIRIAPDTVLFRDPEAFRGIYNVKANVQKAPFYEAWRRDKHEVNSFNTQDKAQHAQLRKLLNQCFTEKSLRAVQPFIIAHVDRWNELFISENEKKEQWSKPINFSDASDQLFFDVMGDLCFGSSLGIKEPGENPFKSIPHAIIQYMQFFSPLTRSPFLGLILWLKPRGLDAFFNTMAPPNIKKYVDFIEHCVAKRIELYKSQQHMDEKEQRQDMFWFLCDAKDDAGRPAYNESELHANANMLIVAGSDTTSTILAALVFYLTRNPGVYKKLVNEICTKFSSAEDIVYGPELTSCVYLRACIDETMRIAPTGPSELPRIVQKGGATISGHFYPEGTIVGIPGWAHGHDEAYYGDSEIFRPERWIPDDTKTQEDINALRAAFNPFSQGPGSCPGKNIAILELQIAVARTLRRFDVRKSIEGDISLGEGSPTAQWGMRNKNIYQLEDVYIAARNGPLVQLRKRVD